MNPPDPTPEFAPFVPPEEAPDELTLAPLLLGAVLGVVFGAASMYLVLKVGLTVSASIPVAVLAITVFKAIGNATILQNNIVQTTGSAGESIAFGVGLVMPALLTLGFDLDAVRVMTVGVLGGLLGILMMIPLRRAFIVQQHGKLKYPEGTACADVLIVGEKGGATARTLFAGFGLGFAFEFLTKGFKLWKPEPEQALYATDAAGKTVGLKAGVLGCEMSAPLLGVGYIIGPRIASIMVAGGVLAYLVITPVIAYFGENLPEPLLPAHWQVAEVDPLGGVAGGAVAHRQRETDAGLIKNMGAGAIRSKYILYIGAGSVAAGGILSMIQALPVIVSSVVAGFKDLRGGRERAASGVAVKRTERDLPMQVVVFGSVGLVLALALVPALGLGLNFAGVAGAVMILGLGFLFVTVSSRLTGEIGSSSNPISGMTVATVLLACLALVALGEAGVLELNKGTKLLALTIAGVVCVACSNGGTTSQALKTGHLLGATPKSQQYAILVGSLSSALAVGAVLILLNRSGTVYSKLGLPSVAVNAAALTETDRVRVGQYSEDAAEYKVLVVGAGEKLGPDMLPGGGEVPPGKYLIDGAGKFAYLVDPAINGERKTQDNGEKVANKFEAPKTQLIALIINGIFDRNLPWDLVLIGVLIAAVLELSGVPALPFAVGIYLPLSSSVPIFVGGAVRALVDRFRRGAAEEGDASPGVLFGSGYIAGGSIAALLAAVPQLLGDNVAKAIDLGALLNVEGKEVMLGEVKWMDSNQPVTVAFGLLALALFVVGLRAGRNRDGGS